MAISDQEKVRITGLAQVERLQADGMSAVQQGRNDDADSIADRLLALSQQTSDQLVSEMAMLAQAGIASGQLAAAASALASVNDQIATATNTFALAARLAQQGEAGLTFPFIAGKAASLLDLVNTLKNAITNTSAQVRAAQGVPALAAALEDAQRSLVALRAQAEKLAS